MSNGRSDLLIHRIRWMLLFAPIAGGAAAYTTDTRSSSPLTSPDLQAYCESLADRRTTAIQQTRVLTGQVERSVELPGSPRLLGGQWDPGQKLLTVFDAAEAQVITLDTLGKKVRSVGRGGEGPAEFRISPVYFGSRQKFRVAPDGRILILDDRFGHVFTRDRQIQEVHFDTLPAGLVTDAHVARIRNAWIVSLAQRSSRNPVENSLVRLIVVPDTNVPRLSPKPLGHVKNLFAQYPSTKGLLADVPYERLYRRTWDAIGETIAVISYRHFAVCLGIPGDSSSWRAWSVAAKPRLVDAQERDRVLKERFGQSTGVAPMMNVRIEDVYRGKWPDVAPFYYDITALNDTTFAVLRLDPEGGVSADLVTVGRGYRGSVKVPKARGVVGGYRDGLLLLNPGDGIVEFLRVPTR